MGHYVWVQQTQPIAITDCPRAHLCLTLDLGGDPPGHSPPTQEKSSGVSSDVVGSAGAIHTLLSHIISCHDEIHTMVSLQFKFCVNFEYSPSW